VTSHHYRVDDSQEKILMDGVHSTSNGMELLYRSEQFCTSHHFSSRFSICQTHNVAATSLLLLKLYPCSFEGVGTRKGIKKERKKRRGCIASWHVYVLLGEIPVVSLLQMEKWSCSPCPSAMTMVLSNFNCLKERLGRVSIC
jgi:hypothetical protein